MSEPPKLFTNKPKKAALKNLQQQSSSPSTMETPSSSKIPPPPPPPPPQPPTESFARRYKFLWPLLLTVNIGVGAYLFMRTKKDTGVEEIPTPTPTPTLVPAPATVAVTTPTLVQAPATVAVTEPVSSKPIVIPPPKSLEPVPENQQRELFKWLLEEKRKVKPKNAEEKKRLDEEKFILKQFIRMKSIQNI